ncbi:MAG: hypothetical protein U9R19_03400 [Bacteroidota bacterium]|nr:hypothetical protein [Bacteroidota bacterium]
MDEICIYLNKHVRSTVLVFALMGFTYLFLGISDLIKQNQIIGIIEILFAIVALFALLINSLPAYQFKLFYCIDREKISVRTHLFQKTKYYFWNSLNEIRITKNEVLLLFDNGKPAKIRLSTLNYNELVFFKKVLQGYLNYYKLEIK